MASGKARKVFEFKKTADINLTSSKQDTQAVKKVAVWEKKQEDLSAAVSISVTEISRKKGHHYLTVVYRIDKYHVRLLWLEKCPQNKIRCLGFRRACLTVIGQCGPQALNVPVRFHIAAHVNRAIDQACSHEAGQFIARWCNKIMVSNIEPMKKIVRMSRRHRELILNYFRAKNRAKKTTSSGVVEGLNNKAKRVFRKSCGYRKLKSMKNTL